MSTPAADRAAAHVRDGLAALEAAIEVLRPRRRRAARRDWRTSALNVIRGDLQEVLAADCEPTGWATERLVKALQRLGGLKPQLPANVAGEVDAALVSLRSARQALGPNRDRRGR